MVKNVGILPIRSGSKGLRDKNIKPMAGYPLFYYSLLKLAYFITYNLLDFIIVSTDSDEYISLVDKYFSQKDDKGVERLFLSKRPEELAKDETSTEEVMFHELRKYDFVEGAVLLLEATSPLIPIRDLELALWNMSNNKVHSSFLVSEDKSQFWMCDKSTDYEWRPLYKKRYRRQDNKEPLYKEIGAWVTDITSFMVACNESIDNASRIIEPVLPVIVDSKFGLSINTLEDFLLCEYILKQNVDKIFDTERGSIVKSKSKLKR